MFESIETPRVHRPRYVPVLESPLYLRRAAYTKAAAESTSAQSWYSVASSFRLVLRSKVGRTEVLTDRPPDPVLLTALLGSKSFERVATAFEILRRNGGQGAAEVLGFNYQRSRRVQLEKTL